jgi:hypothetical protein
LRVRCGGMLRHIFTTALRRRKPDDDRRTSARVSNALGCDAELRSFVPESGSRTAAAPRAGAVLAARRTHHAAIWGETTANPAIR